MTAIKQPTECRILAAGLESTVYRLSSVGGDLVLKKRRAGGKQNYPFEAFAYAQMKQLGATVPAVLFADDDLLLMTALSGQEMDDRERLFDNRDIFTRVASDLAKCHSITLSGFGEPVKTDMDDFRGAQSDWQAYLLGMQPVLDSLATTGSLSDEDLRKLTMFWQQTLPTVELKQGTLVHGDFAMTAIFVDGETYTGLIDFGDALIGDPLMDLAYFRLKEITKPYGTATYKLLVSAYASIIGTSWNSHAEDAIILYMIYWALRRLEHCPDDSLRLKFYDKLHHVAALI